MTEHLPECPVEKMLRSGRTVGSQSCICEHLRACEERVTKRWGDLRGWGETYAFKNGKHSGWESALYAAMEAVASMEIAVVGNSAATIDQALAVIDALREKQ